MGRGKVGWVSMVPDSLGLVIVALSSCSMSKAWRLKFAAVNAP